MTGTEPTLVVDAVGRLCPMPVILLARRIGDVEVGEVVAVVADDPAARADVPAWCRMRGQEYLGEQGPGEQGPGEQGRGEQRPGGAVELRVRRLR